MFISGSSNHNVGSEKNIKDRYLKIGTFCEYHDMVCLHARNRQDMKEVYLWLYKNRFNDSDKIEQFYSHIKKFLKIKENKVIDYGVDSEGTGYLAIEKNDTTLLANLIYNKIALEKILVKIIDIVSKLNARGLYHGMFTEYSFIIDTEKNVSLIEPFGLNGSEQKYQEQKTIINTLKINTEIAKAVEEPMVEEPAPIKVEPNLSHVSELLRQEDICRSHFVR